MKNLIKKLFGKPTTQEKLNKAFDDAFEAQVNAEIKAAYYAHILAFRKQECAILEKWRL